MQIIQFEGAYDGQLSRTMTCPLHKQVPLTYIVVRQDKGNAERIIYREGPFCPICLSISITLYAQPMGGSNV